jgi:lipopolysaccharide export system permease protein
MLPATPPTLFWYLIRSYLAMFFGFCLALLAIIYLFDVVELMRKASKVEDVSIGLVFQMGLLKLPDIGQQISPFAVLFSAMLTFWGMTRRHELTIVRTAGFSIWQIVGPLMLTVGVLGILMSTLVNPVGAMLLSRFQVLENAFLNEKQSLVTIFEQGLWLRQPTEDGYTLLHAKQIDTKTWKLGGVMALYFTDNDSFTQRLDAPSAELQKGAWVFQQALIHRPQATPQQEAIYALPTELTGQDLIDSFASPETMSFWTLPGYIKTLEGTGFDAASLKMHLNALFAQPVFYMAMVLVAACVALRPHRLQQNTFRSILTGVIAGLAIFFFSSFLQALGASHQIPIMLAAWAPSLIVLMLAGGLLLTQEDG